MLYTSPLAPKPSALLADALKLFGPNGEHWIQHQSKQTTRPWWGLGFVRRENYCAIGAIAEVNSANEMVAREYLASAIPGRRGDYTETITHYNDHPDRTFTEIVAWFNSAIARAKADGN